MTIAMTSNDLAALLGNRAPSRASSGPASPPTPAPEASITTAVADAMARASEVLARVMDRALATIDAPPALVAQPGALSMAPAPEPVHVKMRPTRFAVLRNADGEPVSLVPTYGEGRPSNPRSFKCVRDGDGLLEEIIPRYEDQPAA